MRNQERAVLLPGCVVWVMARLEQELVCAWMFVTCINLVDLCSAPLGFAR